MSIRVHTFNQIRNSPIIVSQKLRRRQFGYVGNSTGAHTSTKALLRSIHAMFLPKQTCLLLPKITSIIRSYLARVLRSASIHLSDLNISASLPKASFRRVTINGHVPVSVPPEKKMPFTLSPRGGTNLLCRPNSGGQIRKPSHLQAWRYGSCNASVYLITECDIAPRSMAVLISARSLE
jgi:hypothetical protein